MRFNIEIEDRIRVSRGVYVDSKVRNRKHEVDHLYNKYLNETKIRKEVKDKTNNHPNVLRKHNLVVDSR